MKRVKGWGPWKSRWYSICSAHQKGDGNCHLCRVGRWRNVWLGRMSSFIYNVSPRFWVWLVNLPPHRSLGFIERDD